MSAQATWRWVRVAGQPCQRRGCTHTACLVLCVRGAQSGEELYCSRCAPLVAAELGLPAPEVES